MSKKPLKVIAGTPDHPLVIGNIEIQCYVLEDETRVLSQRGMTAAIGLNPDAGFRIPQLMASKALKPYINNDLRLALNNPIIFKNPGGGGVAYGYPATVLPDICDAIIDADRSGETTERQTVIVERAFVLSRGLSRVGIIALVDEATGYQRIREKRALATILEKYISEELQPWTKTFPYEFYEQIFRLKGWSGPDGTKRPSVIGHYTNDFIYSRLAPGVLDKLRTINPVLPSGGRKVKYFQWFTQDLGHPKLKEHLAGVMALMRAAPNWNSFTRAIQRAYPKVNETIPLALDD